MKAIFILLALNFTLATGEADLVIKLNLGGPKLKVIVKVKRDLVRYDVLPDGGYGNMSRIVNLQNGENFILDEISKKIIKRPSVLETNVIATESDWPRFQDTGKTETLNGCKAKVYQWRNPNDTVETLWIAEGYPNFLEIKSDLIKLDADKLNNKKWMPDFNSLSGMPLKLSFAQHNNSNTNEIGITFTLISAKEEPIDDTNFDLPKDYHLYDQSSPVQTNAFSATNAVISTTNEPLIK